MPPTDSMEKPPTVERTADPIVAFSNSYARLPQHFFARVDPAPAPMPRLLAFNDALASELGFNAQSLEPDALAAVFAGNVKPLAPSRSRWPMPGISSGTSFPSSATAARSSSARSSIATASGGTSN